MTAVDGLRPVEELPRRNLGAKKARIQTMLSSFVESGEDLCEVVMDSTGGPLEEGRIEPLRGYMYRDHRGRGAAGAHPRPQGRRG